MCSGLRSWGLADAASLARQEMRRGLAALQYFTRIPVPAWVGHSQELLDGAARYFPLTGAVVGCAGAAVLALTSLSHTAARAAHEER